MRALGLIRILGLDRERGTCGLGLPGQGHGMGTARLHGQVGGRQGWFWEGGGHQTGEIYGRQFCGFHEMQKSVIPDEVGTWALGMERQREWRHSSVRTSCFSMKERL